MNLFEERFNEIYRQMSTGAGYEDICSKYECTKDQVLEYLERFAKKGSKKYDDCCRILKNNDRKKRKKAKKVEKAKPATADIVVNTPDDEDEAKNDALDKIITTDEENEAIIDDLNKALFEAEKSLCASQMNIRKCYSNMRTLKDLIDNNMKHPVVVELLKSIDNYKELISKLKHEEDMFKKTSEQKKTITDEIDLLREKLKPVVFVYKDGSMDIVSGKITINDSGKDEIFEFIRDRQECQQLTLMDAKLLATAVAVARNAKKEVTFEFDHDDIRVIYLKVYEALKKSEG